MENINKNFVKRVLAASQQNSVLRRANRPGYRFPVRIMKHRMIRNISNAAERMQQLFSRSPSPVPPQEEDDGIIPYDEETDVFNYLNVQNSADYYNNTTASASAATATAAGTDTSNDWWFEGQDEQLGLVNEEEELNSDDDDDEINSYISFNDAPTADDNLSFVHVLDAANDQNQQQQVAAIPSPGIAYTPDLASVIDDGSFDSTADNNSNTIEFYPIVAYNPDLATVTADDSYNLTEINDNAIDQQLIASTTDANNTQDGASTAWYWLANLDPKDLTTADIEQILLTQTSELLSGNLVSADGNYLSTPTSDVTNSDDIEAANNTRSLVETTETSTEVAHEILHRDVPAVESTQEILHGDVSQEEPTDEILHGDVSRDAVPNEMLYGNIPFEELTSSVLYDGVPLEGSTQEILHGNDSCGGITDEMLYGEMPLEEIKNPVPYGDVPTIEETAGLMLYGNVPIETTDEIPYGDVSRETVTDETLLGDVPLEEMTEEEHSSPESSDASCTSPPFQHRTTTLIKEEGNQTWASLSNINNYGLSAPTLYELPAPTQYQLPASTQYQLPVQSQEYATVVQSLQISSTLGKRKLEDEYDCPIPNRKHQKRSLVNN